MAHKHSVYDTDAHFSINPFTRAIKNESTSKVAVIQHDHNSERFTFEIPRLVDGHDMSVCDRVEVHYINMDSANKDNISADIYEVDDLQVSPDDRNFVICSWLLSQNATKYAGSLNFLVRFICLDGEKIAYAWHTAIFTGISVSSGILNNAEEIVEPYVDVLAQWKADLFGVGDTEEQRLLTVSAEQQAAIAAKGAAVLESIPEEYTALNQNVEGNAAKIKELASAIKGELSGAVVRADDVSMVEHNPIVKVHGKNLFDTSKIEVQSSDNIYISAVGEGYIEITTVAGYVSNGHRQTYVKLKNLCPQMVANRSYVLNAETDSTLEMAHLRDVDYFVYFGKPFVVTDDMLESYLAFYGLDTRNDTTGGICRISNIQIEEGETATEYTPYVDPETVRVVKCGKNLITNLGKSVEGTGIEWTKKEDGTVVANGTAETDCVYGFDVVGWNTCLVGNTVTLSGCPSGGAIEKFAVVQRNYGRFDTGSGVTFVIDNQNFSAWGIKVEAGVTVNNLVFKPQLEVGSIATVYEQHKIPTDHTPAADGTVSGMTSLSPCMTILTDTDGAIVECAYNIDTKTYIDNKIKELMEGVTE